MKHKTIMNQGTIFAIIILLLSGILLPPSLCGAGEIEQFNSKMSSSSNSLYEKEQVLEKYSEASQFFIKNVGQFPEQVLFQTHASGATLFLCKDRLISVFSESVTSQADLEIKKQKTIRSASLETTFKDANTDVIITGEQVVTSSINYMYGNNPDLWYTNVPTYQSVLYNNIYPGIDLRYYFTIQGSLKYDFIINPSAKPHTISIHYNGAKNVKITETNDLEIITNMGSVFEKAPVIYQEINGVHSQICGSYIIKEKNTMGISLQDSYNPAYPLIIDPELIYSTFLGGYDNVELPNGITVDSNQNVYITGETNSFAFPVVNPYDGTYNGNRDIFISKLSPLTGGPTSLIYSTYLGGTAEDVGENIKVNSNGNAFVTGWTTSSNFPTYSAYDSSFNGGVDTFITKLSPTGNTLAYSTYLGGTNFDFAQDIIIDSSQNAYVVGQTNSSNYPTISPYDASWNGGYDVFVTKLSSGGNTILYSTYLGSSDNDYGRGIDFGNGVFYVTGGTYSSGFPVINAYDSSHNGNLDAFVTKFSSSGSSLLFSTFVGGSAYEISQSIAVDFNGNAYITGRTLSSNFPTANPYDSSFNGGADAFLVKLSSGGNSLLYGTYLGGSLYDESQGVVVDNLNNAYIVGNTSSSNFPTKDAYDSSYNGGSCDVFVAKFLPTSAGDASLIMSTYFGGSTRDVGKDIAVDQYYYIHFTGLTCWSTNFPIVNPYDSECGHQDDCFVSTFEGLNFPPWPPNNPNPVSGSQGVSLQADLSWCGGDPNLEDTVMYDVYFGTNSNPSYYSSTPYYPANQTTITFPLPSLAERTRYYWKIVACDQHCLLSVSPVWNFSTEGGGGPTCFLAGTLISMADGSLKKIENVKVGDMLKSYDETGSKIMNRKVTEVFHHAETEMSGAYLIINKNIKVTFDHLLYVNGQWTAAGKTRIGDLLFGLNGYPVPIVSIRKQSGFVKTYNLEVEKDHNYFANLVLVHNNKQVCIQAGLDGPGQK